MWDGDRCSIWVGLSVCVRGCLPRTVSVRDVMIGACAKCQVLGHALRSVDVDARFPRDPRRGVGRLERDAVTRDARDPID